MVHANRTEDGGRPERRQEAEDERPPWAENDETVNRNQEKRLRA